MANNPRVVIIDDDAVTLHILSSILKELGFHVQVANDAATGFERVRNEIPDLVILDVYLPDGDGFTLLSEFRQYPSTHKIPVVMLTNDEQDKSVRRAFDLGADAYLTKPFHPDVLHKKINDLLKTSA